MMRKAILLTAILAVSLLSVLPVSAATSITLSPGGDIQSAIENISDGGTIYLQGGTYYANLIIDAPHKSFSEDYD